MHYILRISFILLTFLFLSGCALTDAQLTLSTPELSNQSPLSAPTVFINKPTDARAFGSKTANPSIPSTQPSLIAIGRKSNAFGTSLGTLFLAEPQSVDTVIEKALRKAFDLNGYRVVTDKNEISSTTLLVNPKILQFWTWMQPGFWQITLSNIIEAQVNVNNRKEKKEETFTAIGEYSEGFQVGTEGNYQKVINQGYKNFIENATQAISRLRTKETN